MSRLWSMFRFRSFRIFCEKIAIFRTFDHWSEILSMSAGRPLGQGVCPPLPVWTNFNLGLFDRRPRIESWQRQKISTELEYCKSETTGARSNILRIYNLILYRCTTLTLYQLTSYNKITLIFKSWFSGKRWRSRFKTCDLLYLTQWLKKKRSV